MIALIDGRIFRSAEDVLRPLYYGTDWCSVYLLEDRVNKSVKGGVLRNTYIT